MFTLTQNDGVLSRSSIDFTESHYIGLKRDCCVGTIHLNNDPIGERVTLLKSVVKFLQKWRLLGPHASSGRAVLPSSFRRML